MRFDKDASAAAWTLRATPILLCVLVGCSGCTDPTQPAIRNASEARSESYGAESQQFFDAGGIPRIDAGLPVPSLDAGMSDSGARLLPDSGARPFAEAPAPTESAFFGRADAPIREALINEAFASAERGRGGRSLAFKIRLAQGTRAYFKPNQTFNGTTWYAEIAAYHLDRELGLGRVAPVVGRRFEWSQLEDAAGRDARVNELVIRDGQLNGALMYWVPERLVALELPDGWIEWLRIEGEPARNSPFVRPNQLGRVPSRTSRGSVPAPDRPDRPAEMSDMIVFDYLVHNADRWGTNNTNVRTIGDGGPLMFLDNAASFTLRRPRVALMDSRLHEVQRFRRSTIDAVRRFDAQHFAARMAADPLVPSLDARQLANLEIRRHHLLEYVDGLVERHGEEAVYAW